MATPDQLPTDLTLDLGDDLGPEDFVAAVRNFFGYVKEITDSQAGDGSEIAWTVRVSEGSNLVGLEPSPSAPKSRLAMVYRKAAYGVEALSVGDLQGSGLTDKAMTHLKVISELAAKTEAHRSITVWIEKKPSLVSAGIAKAIKESWETDYYDFGTVEGRLEAIQDANGALKIKIQDFLFPRPINCIVPDHMVDKVFSSFRRRVEIVGRIHYRRDGTPISIETDDIDTLPEDAELPSAADVKGIISTI